MKNLSLVFVVIMLFSLNQAALAEQSGSEPPLLKSNCTLPDWNGGSVNYYKTCTDIEVKDCTIHASCKRIDGSYRNATFSLGVFYNKCPTSWGSRALSNIDGRLCCNWAGQPSMCGG